MAPPDNGNDFSSFVELMALEVLDSNTFRSKHLPFGPADGSRAYGGHVFAQACYAAAQTVKKESVLHNVTGWFLIAGKTNEQFTYKVRNIRDGGFTTRGVDVFQSSDPGCCFTCICSFKRPEKPSSKTVDVRQQLDIASEFSVALKGMKPHEHPEMPGIDAPWYWDYSRSHGYNDPFPGLHLHKVDMHPYNTERAPLERRSLKFYSTRGAMPPVEDDPNLHVCAHLYASDRNSLFVISNHLDIGDDYSVVASLAHTVILHGNAEELDMIDRTTGQPRWCCQESWTGGARQGRGTHETRMWRDDGLHIASTLQDGLVRLKSEGADKKGFSSDGMTERMDALRKSQNNKL